MTHNRTAKSDFSRNYKRRNNYLPCQFSHMMTPTLLTSRTVNETKNMILMWVCAWKMMRTHCTALIETVDTEMDRDNEEEVVE